MATTTAEQTVKISVSLQTERGPVAAEHSAVVDTISFSKPKVASSRTLTVTVTPGEQNLHYVVVKSSVYSKEGKKVTIKAIPADKTVELDAPIAVLGAAAIQLFGDAPTKFEIDNQAGVDIELEIATGWKLKATASQPSKQPS